MVVSNFTPKSEAVTVNENTSYIIQDKIPQKANKTDIYSLYKELGAEIKDLKCKIDDINKELVKLKKV